MRSISAPVMDRHPNTGKRDNRGRGREGARKHGGEGKYKCTCHVYGQTHQYGGDEEKASRGERPKQTEGERRGEKYECTCHVYGQTHKYKNLVGGVRGSMVKQRSNQQKFRVVFPDLSESS